MVFTLPLNPEVLPGELLDGLLPIVTALHFPADVASQFPECLFSLPVEARVGFCMAFAVGVERSQSDVQTDGLASRLNVQVTFDIYEELYGM